MLSDKERYEAADAVLRESGYDELADKILADRHRRESTEKWGDELITNLGELLFSCVDDDLMYADAAIEALNYLEKQGIASPPEKEEEVEETELTVKANRFGLKSHEEVYGNKYNNPTFDTGRTPYQW